MKTKILIHPDIFYSSHAGAVVCREGARQLTKLGYEVAVFTPDEENREVADYKYYQRIPFRGISNYISYYYKKSFNKVIDDYKPDYVFFIGAIVNTPVVYLDICRKRNIKTAFLLFVQDFFCARLHAGLGTGECTLCLDKNNSYAWRNNCAEKQRNPLLYLLSYQIIQKMFLPRLRKVDFVLGSSDQQLDFYEGVGIKRSNVFKIPMFFDQNRIVEYNVPSKPYFVILGQFRHEKGLHLISSILEHVKDGIVVKLLLYNQAEADKFYAEYPDNKKHIKSGKLEVLPGITMLNGANELLAGSRGIINPSIWATTTETVLLEALGHSKPIITFDVGIHKEVIDNRINGICVKAGDFKTMGEEINNLNDDLELQANIAPEAKRLYHKLTDESSFTEILTSIFKKPLLL